MPRSNKYIVYIEEENKTTSHLIDQSVRSIVGMATLPDMPTHALLKQPSFRFLESPLVAVETNC